LVFHGFLNAVWIDPQLFKSRMGAKNRYSKASWDVYTGLQEALEAICSSHAAFKRLLNTKTRRIGQIYENLKAFRKR
jgi:hypothetical protein